MAKAPKYSSKFAAIRPRSAYWRPGDDYVRKVVELVRGRLRNGDAVAISEKAVAVASGRVVDESKIEPGLAARALARFWMRAVWGRFLGYLCRLKPSTIAALRSYPPEEGARHKQLALWLFGPLQALRFGSEGGLDCANLPYSYACLPLDDPAEAARRVYEAIREELGREAIVLIVDSDKAYSLGSFHFSPTRSCVRGIKYGFGVVGYVIGRALKARPRSVPRAIWPPNALAAEEALEVAEAAHRARGHGAGRNVWEMALRFGVRPSEVTWEMLASVPHIPVVIVRRRVGSRAVPMGAARGASGRVRASS